VGFWKDVLKIRAALRHRRNELEMTKFAVGVNSTVDWVDDLHVVMLDYDTESKEKVVESVRELQAFWALADVCIYRTKHGFHAIGWYDHVPYERLRMIVDFAKYVDPLFKHITRRYDHKTLRVVGKHKERDIEFVDVVPGVRTPERTEVERGELLRRNHASLTGAMFSERV
jgi:hypothetical protein